MERKIKNVEGKEQKTQYFDYGLLAIVIFLVCFGLVMLYSTSSYAGLEKFDDSMFFFKRQCRAALIGLAGMMFVSVLPYRKLYSKFAKLAYFASFGFLLLV